MASDKELCITVASNDMPAALCITSESCFRFGLPNPREEVQAAIMSPHSYGRGYVVPQQFMIYMEGWHCAKDTQPQENYAPKFSGCVA